MTRLLWLIDEHRGPLRADFRREYGLDIDAVLDERTVRPLALLDLIDHLTPAAALWRTIEPDTVWGLPEALMALLVDEIRVLRWEFERVNFKGRTKPPEPLPRPGVKPRVEVDTIGAGEGFDTIAEFEAWYGQARTEATTG